ncbi:UNVERIFIED_CONTAM: hypothetical protein Sradi_2015600 [Sesamum radiatum]|uniref:Reverse transcriptase n=1 Tax=Sesamum radiatum TaxID=300843 RepID=A0AAW2TGS6_SESRA
MKAFNKAMLAKQGWRLVTRPNALLSQLLRAKYFPGSTFLDAQMGPRPSLTWRSLIGARDLLIRGCRCKIRLGREVHIWGDRWVRRPSEFRVSLAPEILFPDARVAELIDRNRGGWREELVRQVVDEETTQIIFTIALPHVDRPDELIWHYDSKGQFSVHSAYQLELKSNQQHILSTSNPQVEDIWGGIMN